jgi:hypothetical protein
MSHWHTTRSKYHNRKQVEDGRVFDSKHELGRWQELKLMQLAGLIDQLERQVRLPLGVCYDNGREAVLVVDFSYREKGTQRYEDAKGFETAVSKLKRAILRSKGIEVALV